MAIFGFIKNGKKVKVNYFPATYPAGNVTFDNTQSGMTATDVQGAIDELNADITPKKIATASANQTWGAQLTYLQTAFNALTQAEKIRSFIVFNGGMIARYSNSTYDVHIGFNVSANNFESNQMSITNPSCRQFDHTSGTVYNVKDVVNSGTLELWV